MRVKLEEICKRIYAGGDVPKNRYSMERTGKYNIPIYANAEKDMGLYGYTDEAREFDVAVTVAARGTIGFAAIRNEPFLPVVRLITIVPELEKVTPQYLLYALKNYKPKSSGTSIPQLTVPEIKRYSFNLVGLNEQKRISGILDKLFNIIEKRNIELLEYDKLIKARFVEMFGDPEGDDKYPQISIKEFTDVISGGTPDRKNNEYWENGTIPWVKTTELQNNMINSVEECITEKGLNESSAKVVPADTVLIAMYGQGKTRGMTAILGIPASTNQACACILPCDTVESKYLWQYMVISYDRLRNLAQGGNQPNLNGNMIKNFTVLVPPLELQVQFVKFVEQVDKSKVAVQKALDETQTLFDSLMQEYFG